MSPPRRTVRTEPVLLHSFFDATARRWPERVALEIPPGRGRPDRSLMTYAELARQSDALARRLCEFVRAECVIGILLPRSTEQLFIAQLAVQKAGAAYTCLDSSFPDERIQTILKDSAAVALLTDAAGAQRTQGWEMALPPLIDLTTIPIEVQPSGVVASAPAPAPWLGPHSLAYLVYTSGSTGQPKGVMIEHQGIANLVAGDLDAFGLSPADRVAQGSSAAYDSSIEETWLAFAAGATLVVMDDEATRSGPDLVAWLRQERISVFCPPPTLLRATGCADPQAALPDLKLLYVGGEALPRDVADLWSRGRRMVNGYGPTECSVTCLRGPVLMGEPIGIGMPVRGMAAWVLNEALEEVATGEPGELCMGGVGLARGYWGQPELTAQKFVAHPRLGRLYRTGDQVLRDAAGQFFYQGRIDAQVKLRGYRVELGEIESRLAQCAGVRAAACHVQHEGQQAVLVAFILPQDAAAPPAAQRLKAELAAALPAYMVPARFGWLDALPTTVGGKLNRAALPHLAATAPAVLTPIVDEAASADDLVPLTDLDPLQARIADAMAEVMRLPLRPSIDHDFFEDLGGDSLGAALLVTRLRDDPASAWITVRDVYEARSVAGLAARVPAGHPPLSAETSAETSAQPSAQPAAQPAAEPAAEPTPKSQHENDAHAYPVLVTIAQTLWLLALLSVGSMVSWWVLAQALPWLGAQLGLVGTILLAPALALAAFAVYAPCAVLLAVAVKRALIGRYQPLRAPVWGGFYLRNWIVQQAVRLVPWPMLQGTVFQQTALRALGARIGQRVHIHRGVDLLRGGWDLLDIGDDVSLGQDAGIRLVELDAGHIVIGPVRLGDGATLATRAGVAPHTIVEAGGFLTALSSLPAGACIPHGECWDGIPAARSGLAPPRPDLIAPASELSPHVHGLAMMLTRAAMGLAIALPAEGLAIITCLAFGLGAEQAWAWAAQPWLDWRAGWLALGVLIVSVPLTLLWAAALMRLLGPVAPRTISRWSLAYIRVWLKTGLLHAAGAWLSGSLFWPLWLRAAGMQVGRGCEISTILDVLPELFEIGPESFFADGIYLGGPLVHQGRVGLARTRLGSQTFLGNHVVVPAGQHWPSGVLLGVATTLGEASLGATSPGASSMGTLPPRAGSAWFGHPPFELPRREVVQMDRRLTHQPSALRYANRLFWESLRFALPSVPLGVSTAWFAVLSSSALTTSGPIFWLLVVPAASLGAAAALCAVVLALKWLLLGRVRPGQHALWSCWASRWDFVYVAWGQYARGALERLDGTLLLTGYLRAMGMTIGKRVVLGPGFSQVVDPDMLVLEDGATVNAMFQAHTFEDRVLKIDRITVRHHATLGSATVPLYGADIGAGTHVGAHSVVMKRERLAAGQRYEGAPTRLGSLT